MCRTGLVMFTLSIKLLTINHYYYFKYIGINSILCITYYVGTTDIIFNNIIHIYYIFSTNMYLYHIFIKLLIYLQKVYYFLIKNCTKKLLISWYYK